MFSGAPSTLSPPQKLYVETVRRIKRISREIARELNISGPFNIQYLARENDIKVIECNLRASRSFPFVSKVLKINLIELATKVMLGIPVQKPDKNLFDLDYVGCPFRGLAACGAKFSAALRARTAPRSARRRWSTDCAPAKAP